MEFLAINYGRSCLKYSHLCITWRSGKQICTKMIQGETLAAVRLTIELAPTKISQYPVCSHLVNFGGRVCLGRGGDVDWYPSVLSLRVCAGTRSCPGFVPS